MTMQTIPPVQPGTAQPAPLTAPQGPPPRTGAFGSVRSRWLPLWALIGGIGAAAVAAGVAALAGVSVSDDLLGVLFYLPVLAWVLLAVGRRAGVRLSVMLRWPRLGRYWWVVAGMFVVQLLFSLGAATLTQLIVPGLDDALAGVGQGNLALALLGIVVLPSLVEETVFRGILLERFAIKRNVTVAILVSAALFGILHVDPVGAGAFGVITALLYLRTGSLWPGILIHAANNLVALTALRLAGPEVEPPPVDVAESLAAAAVFLALSVPFLVWFLRATWPPRGVLTPYQAHELATGLPPRHVDGVIWSGAPEPVRLTATSTHLVVGTPRTSPAPAQPLAVLPLERVRAAYPTAGPVGEQVVVLLHDGSWTTMRVRGGQVRATGQLAQIITERARPTSAGPTSAGPTRARATSAGA